MHCNRTKSVFALLFPLVFAITILAGCGGGGSQSETPIDDPRAPRSWTVLVYMAADNDLEEYGIQDMNELETVGSTNQATILVQIDRKAGGDESNGGWSTTRRYRITRDSDEATINSQLLADLGELNMASPTTLTDFVRWGVENYPAQHYLLVLWDHGQGWQTRTLMTRPQVRAIHVDAASGYDEMSLPDLEQALSAAPHMDIILFDACLMGMIEVAYSIRNSADIMVASEEDIPLQGQPYQSLAGRLVSNPSIDPGSLSSGIVNDYVNHYIGSAKGTLSAINLTRLDDLTAATNEFADQMSASLGTCGNAIETAADQTQHYDTRGSYADYRDLYDFATRVRASVVSVPVRTAATGVITAIDNLVVAQRNTGGVVTDSHGISIYLPTPATRTNALLTQYEGISFGRDTDWDEFLATY